MKKWGLTFLFASLAFCGKAQSGDEQKIPTEQVTSTSPKIKVFPNPATRVVNVLGLQNTPKAHITVSDMYGKVLLTHEWEVRNHALNIPISNLDPGIYMIVIRSEAQQVQTKFLKQ